MRSQCPKASIEFNAWRLKMLGSIFPAWQAAVQGMSSMIHASRIRLKAVLRGRLAVLPRTWASAQVWGVRSSIQDLSWGLISIFDASSA